jgi:N-terminal region of glycosyl transferase group 7/N-terminal domain of galactosyltransferase
MDKHKLGIIVPYRDRERDLPIFIEHMTSYLDNKDIHYEIIIVGQDNGKQFNRGMLLNVGYIYAKKLKCTYMVFHDIDMLPIDVDYSFSETPLHMATDFILEQDEKKREVFEEYFGGVTMFSMEAFEKINGYSNKYWGWGYEDTDLLYRCKVNDIPLDTHKIKNIGKKGMALKFNGVTSYVKCNNTIDLNNNATFFVSFHPEKFILDHTKESDEFSVFSIPGWDFAICYNSFMRYNFCAFDTNHNPYFVNSEIKTNYKTNMVVVLDRNEKFMKVYQDGILIGQTGPFKKLYFYRKEPKFYLGAGKPGREKIPNLFKGTIDSFAYYDEILSDDEIFDISTNTERYLNEDFGKYKSKEFLKIYYDADFIEKYCLTDLTGNNNNGKIMNCEIVFQGYDEYTEVKIPHRRKSLFKSLKHDENGVLGNKWKDQATRWNQLRFHNEVFLNPKLIEEDGISNLEFIEHGKKHKGKILHVNVGI